MYTKIHSYSATYQRSKQDLICHGIIIIFFIIIKTERSTSPQSVTQDSDYTQ